MKTLYYNGIIYTGELPLQEAFIVENNYFLFVGSNQDALEQQIDRKINLNGAFVCAGFNDSHMHLLSYGQTLTTAPLAQHTSTLSDMLNCLSLAIPGTGGWIIGRGWNQDYFQDVNRMPNRWDLDQVSLEHPVCAVRACGHALSVNSKALELIGVTSCTPQIEGGQIVIEHGEPNGIFFDNAMSLVYDAIPVPTKEEVKDMIYSACQALNTYGITSCQSDDYCVFQGLPWQVINAAYHELEEEGRLTVRVYEQANFTNLPALSGYVSSGNNTGTGTDFFRMGPLKMLGDGALGARTAYLSKPYDDNHSTRGLSVFTPEEFDQLISYAHEQQMQVAVHCIGDACLDLVLNSIEKALQSHPRRDHRHGIVHCQITRPDQLKRIAQNNLHIYAQSIFLDYDIHMVQQRVGKELADSSYSWKTLQTLGSSVSNGSDCPVELPRVLAGIQCAVTRCDLNGYGPYLEKEAFTVQEALDSFTKTGAWASFEENQKGQIKPGMLADFVVLGKNLFETDISTIKDIPVLMTVMNGNPVYGSLN